MAAQTRFLNCSIALEVVFAILMMVGFAMSIARSRQKKYKDQDDANEVQLKKARAQQNSQQAMHDGINPAGQQRKSPNPPNPTTTVDLPAQPSAEADQSFCSKMVQKIDLFLTQLPLLSILALNIVCFSCYEYLLISALVYITLTLIRLQDFCGIKNIYAKLFLEKFPLVIIGSWFVNFFISELSYE